MTDTASAPAKNSGVVISSHIAGTTAVIDMIEVPAHELRKGRGRAAYEAWERALPPQITHVEVFAADTGSGPSDGFWDALGFSYHFEGPDLTYEEQKIMCRGVNGHPTPKAHILESLDT